ncbi:glycogen synthase [Shewanella sp. 30m-9]
MLPHNNIDNQTQALNVGNGLSQNHTLSNELNRAPTEATQARVLMLAAENGAIAGAKVGGMADVINDLPVALAELNIAVDVAMPSFGSLIAAANAHWLADVDVEFSGKKQQVGVYRALNPKLANSHFYLFEHPLFHGSHGAYSQGDASRPFAEDATKFALFNLAVAEALRIDFLTEDGAQYFADKPSHIHLHDWHNGLFAVLRAFDSRYGFLQDLPCVFSIHNLALQGIRPFNDEASSFAAWYPHLSAELTELQCSLIKDPRYSNCINPMRAGIVLSDKVHLVSPSYALEVLSPSLPEQGFFGGEGLELDLQHQRNRNNLVGILNGCMYPQALADVEKEVEQGGDNEHCSNVDAEVTKQEANKKKPSKKKPSKKANQQGRVDLTKQFIDQALNTIIQWQVGKAQVRTQDFIAQWRLQQWQTEVTHHINLNSANAKEATHTEDTRFIMTSVGRLTDQKVMLLRSRFELDNDDCTLRGRTVLEALLIRMAAFDVNARFVMLGSGDAEIAREFSDIAAKHQQFIFLDGYDEQLSDKLYKLGSLFLMPSSFEPCGISQMLAMRAGQLCLVNRIGGLKDTVHHLETGFTFEGGDIPSQGAALLQVFDEATTMVGSARWNAMQQSAKAQRFDWHSQAKRYQALLYDCT